MSSSRCRGWEKRFARVENRWLERVVQSRASGSEFRVLLYYVSRTWGDYDGRRGRAGRPCVRVSSREVGAEIGMSDSHVRKVTERLIDKRLLRRYRPAAGRRPAAIGPEPLLSLRTRSAGETAGNATKLPLDEVLEALSPQLRQAIAGGRGKWQA